MMTPSHLSAFLAPFAISALMLTGTARAELVRFSDDVLPILELRCIECHKPGGTGYAESGLDLRTHKGLMTGTTHGPIVIPGNAMLSNLNVLVEGRANPRLRMPHRSKRLTSCEVDILRRWVNQGALNN